MERRIGRQASWHRGRFECERAKSEEARTIARDSAACEIECSPRDILATIFLLDSREQITALSRRLNPVLARACESRFLFDVQCRGLFSCPRGFNLLGGARSSRDFFDAFGTRILCSVHHVGTLCHRFRCCCLGRGFDALKPPLQRLRNLCNRRIESRMRLTFLRILACLELEMRCLAPFDIFAFRASLCMSNRRQICGKRLPDPTHRVVRDASQDEQQDHDENESATSACASDKRPSFFIEQGCRTTNDACADDECQRKDKRRGTAEQSRGTCREDDIEVVLRPREQHFDLFFRAQSAFRCRI